MIFVLLVRKIGKCSAATKRPHAAATSAGSTPWVAPFFILLGLRWTVGPFTWTFLSALSRLLTFLGNQTIYRLYRHQWQYYIVCVQRRTIQETDLTAKTRKKPAGQHASSAQACSHSWHRFHKGPKSAKLHVCIKDVVAMMLVHDNVARMSELLPISSNWLPFAVSRMLFRSKNTKEKNGWPTIFRRCQCCPCVAGIAVKGARVTEKKPSWATPATQGFGEFSQKYIILYCVPKQKLSDWQWCHRLYQDDSS